MANKNLNNFSRQEPLTYNRLVADCVRVVLSFELVDLFYQRKMEMIASEVNLCTLRYNMTSFLGVKTSWNKIDKPLVVYRFKGNVMTSKVTLRTCIQTKL